MGQFFSLHNCNVMHYNSKLVCNGNYISITFELHLHLVTFLHKFLQIKNALSLHLSIFLLILSSSLLFALIMPHLLSQNVLVHIFTSQLVFCQNSSGGFRGGSRGSLEPPYGPKSFHFHEEFQEILYEIR